MLEVDSTNSDGQQEVKIIISGEAAKKKLLETKECVGCDLNGTSLRGAELFKPNLRGAELYKANLRGAILYKASGTWLVLS